MDSASFYKLRTSCPLQVSTAVCYPPHRIVDECGIQSFQGSAGSDADVTMLPPLTIHIPVILETLMLQAMMDDDRQKNIVPGVYPMINFKVC